MTEAEKLARLRLIRTENVGPVTFRRLVDRFGSATRALEVLPDLAKRGGKAEALKPFPKDEAEKEIEKTGKYGAKIIAEGEEGYPGLLAETEDAPPLITVLGNPALLSKKSLAVVGARNASLAGRKIAETFSGKVAGAGYIIVSGLARGIDTAAHLASLKTGTVAVLAGGIDNIYPPENEKLYRQIAEEGAIVAESPFGTAPVARHFPRRNRIVAGLALGVLVVEAAAKSGSLITARLALEQNRELFAVPGSPLDPRAEGCNSLLRDGAHITTTAEDIIHVLRSLRHDALREKPAEKWKAQPGLFAEAEADENIRTRILECLSPAPVAIDELIRAAEVPAHHVLSVLLELELAGRVERQAGNKVSLI